jgi:hypothetical protein
VQAIITPAQPTRQQLAKHIGTGLGGELGAIGDGTFKISLPYEMVNVPLDQSNIIILWVVEGPEEGATRDVEMKDEAGSVAVSDEDKD